ncbi:MAG TPA: primosomal protein N' [bacterium]|nr:primosomal protein N' [bacterium]
MDKKYVDIAFPRPLWRSFTYKIPGFINTPLQIGQRIVVPLRGKETIGFVAGLKGKKPEGVKLKPIYEVIDTEPVFPSELLGFLKVVAKYYLTPLGKILKSTIPKEYRVKRSREIVIGDIKQNPDKYEDIFTRIQERGSLRYQTLRKDFDREYLAKGLDYLKRHGHLREQVHFKEKQTKNITKRTIKLSEKYNERGLEEVPKNAPQQRRIIKFLKDKGAIKEDQIDDFSTYSIDSLHEKGLIEIEIEDVTIDRMWHGFQEKEKQVTLNDEQQAVFDAVSPHIIDGSFESFLLHGVTGSGKTEVYIKLIKEARQAGKSALVLVPEITLTTHLASRFKGAFGDDIAIWHSNLKQSYRSKIWKMILNDEISIVIGARSALFLPLQELGLIILDEEHDSSFKQNGTAPRYHARDAALIRGLKSDAPVLLGSATPSIESHYNAATNKFTLLEMKKRFSTAKRPRMHIVDLKKSWKSGKKPNNLYSNLMLEKIQGKTEKGEQVLLLQNRRGYSNFLLCSNCSWTPRCRNCDVTLTYHKTNKKLVCHYCNYSQSIPKQCPECGGEDFILPGFGTQKAETMLEKILPDISIARMDADTTRKKGALKKLLNSFDQKEIDVLIGTQMIAKGLDFHNVTLVGVLNADIGLSLPDFRSRERVFQLLHQVAGRVGRGDKRGEVVIQTFQPDDFTIKCAITGDIDTFKNREYSERNETGYPPFSRMASIIFSGLKESEIKKTAWATIRFLKRYRRGIEILGPTQAPIGKIKNRYRYMAILKSRKDRDENGAKLRALLKRFIHSQKYRELTRKVKISIDVDPIDLL